MTETNTCPKCDAPLPADAPEGACPKCLLQAGFESADGADTAIAPDLADVAERFPELEILSELGRGGMGVVYKARQKNLDRLVALKVLPRAIVEGDGGGVRFEERFTREAQALGRLSHPNIVGVHEFGEREGVYYFLMEFVDGVNLRQAMRAEHLTPVEALAIVPQICDALQYAHDQGIVHRDIKPENVLVDKSGHVKIADFGLAKLITTAPGERALTKQGLVMGTPHYMAPEQFEKPTEVDHRADIYSLGVVLYEMLTGELPIGRFAPPSEKVRIDVRLDEVVLRSLEKDADRRYQAVSDLKTGIGAAGDDPGSGEEVQRRYSKTFEVGSATEGSQRSSLALWAFLVPVLAVLAGFVIASAVTTFQSDGSSWGTVGVPLTVASLLVGVSVLAGIVMALVAIVRIQRSEGRLHGLGWAIAGMLMPLLCCVPASGFLYMAPMRQAHDEPERPQPYEETGLIAPAERLERAGEVQIDLVVPAGPRGVQPFRLDIQGRGSSEEVGDATATVTSTSSWPLPADHLFVVTRVTVTGDIGESRPMVHVGEVVIPGPDASGTDPTWVGAVTIPAGSEHAVYADVAGQGATYVAIEGHILRRGRPSAPRRGAAAEPQSQSTVSLRVPEGVVRVDLTGRFDGAAVDKKDNALIVPPGHFFLIEKVEIAEPPRRGQGSVHIGGQVIWFDATRVEGASLWAGELQVHPGCEAGVFVRSSEGAPLTVDVTGRVYRVADQK